MKKTLGWCHECADFVEVEQLPEPETLLTVAREVFQTFKNIHERNQAMLPAWLRKILPRILLQNILNKEQSLWQNFLHHNAFHIWRKDRRLSARCLSCGSCDIETYEGDICGQQHHRNCDGHLYREDLDFHMLYEPRTVYFDGEGRQVSKKSYNERYSRIVP